MGHYDSGRLHDRLEKIEAEEQRKRQEIRTRFRCVVCGKLTSGRVPVNPTNHRERGDGTFRYPRRHRDQRGTVCPGSYKEADWVDVEVGSQPSMKGD